jgi:predicted transcriptional regulator
VTGYPWSDGDAPAESENDLVTTADVAALPDMFTSTHEWDEAQVGSNGHVAAEDIPFAPELPDVHISPVVATGKLTWQTLEEVDMRSIVFLDKPLLQADAFHLVAGRKGQGKGTLLAEIAARVTRGELGAKRNVVWIGSEDSAAIDIKPRIVAAGGDPARVLVVKEGWIQLPRDYDAIRRAMADFGDVGMLVVDPVGNHISGKNSDADTDIRDSIAPLNQIADEFECMVFGVRHLSEKDRSKGVLAAILGASAWVHVPRAVLAVARDNEDPDVSHVQCVSGNRLPAGTPGRMFRIEGVLLPGLENEVTRATWLGDSSKDVETMLSNSNSKEPSRSTAATELILDILDSEGEQESDALDARVAQETGVKAKTVQNLRSKLSADGLIASRPEKDEQGAVTRWLVHRTLAPRGDA